MIPGNVTECKSAEAVLKEREKKYRTLFENMPEGVAYCRMLFDDKGHPADFIYLNVNPAFNRIIGTGTVLGKPVSAGFPGIKNACPKLFEICGRVALTGMPVRTSSQCLIRKSELFGRTRYSSGTPVRKTGKVRPL